MTCLVNRFTSDKEYTDFVNANLLAFMNTHSNGKEDLGPGFKNLSLPQVTANLQYYRLKKKFETPSEDNNTVRAENAVLDMIAYDSNGIKTFQPGRLDLDPFTRHILYNARKSLNEAIANYRFSVLDLELTSGETFVSSRGDTSVYAKLRDIKQWTVTRPCFDLAAQLVYNSPMLRYAAKRHVKNAFNKRFKHAAKRLNTSMRDLWIEYNARIEKCVRTEHPKASKQQIGFLCFKRKLKSIVTFVAGARITTVPKNNDTDRVIECECMLNMWVQRTIARQVRKLIKEYFGIDLATSQVLHGKMIADLSNATIDLKNASNSVWLSVVDWFMGKSKLGQDLFKSRCGTVIYNGSYHKLTMLSPMGNGFTFEIMTLLLLTISRQLDDFAHVYGDDIIIDSDVAQYLISVLDTIGFRLNETKTFLDGPFRESCGAFCYESSYIISYDMFYAQDIVDAIILTNKIGIMANATDSDLSKHWLTLHYKLLERCPRDLLRGFNFSGICYETLKFEVADLADGVLIDFRRLNRLRAADSEWLTLYKTQQIDHLDRIIDLSYKPWQFMPYRYVFKQSVSYDASRTWRAHNRVSPSVSRLLSWFYIWSGRCIAPSLTATVIRNEWRYQFVDKTMPCLN